MLKVWLGIKNEEDGEGGAALNVVLDDERTQGGRVSELIGDLKPQPQQSNAFLSFSSSVWGIFRIL